tara:strand:+ start:626 stop:925 length:300 start_codon:yes stop_codon:yes gene_type:complete
MSFYNNINLENLAKSELGLDGVTNPTTSQINTKVAEIKIRDVRGHRNYLLTESDWVVVNAQELGTTVTDEWKTYRQALRDITKTSATSMDDVVWPTKPN